MTYYFHRNWNFQTVMLLEHLTADKLEFSGCLSGFINHNGPLHVTSAFLYFYYSMVGNVITGSLIGLLTYTSHWLYGYGIVASCIYVCKLMTKVDVIALLVYFCFTDLLYGH